MPPSKTSKILTSILFAVGGLFLASNLLVSSAFAGRAYPGVSISGLAIGGKTSAQIRNIAEGLAANQPSVVLRINQQTFELSPASIGSRVDVSAIQTGALENHLAWLPILGITKKPSAVTESYRVDHDKLADSLKTIIAQVNQPASDAMVAVVAGQVTIVPGKPGTGVEIAAAQADIAGALAVGAHQVEISVGSVAPTVTPESLKPLAQQMQQLIGLPITLKYQNQTFNPDKATVGSWLGESNGPSGPQIVTKPDQIRAYINKIGKTINVAAKNQLIDTVNGAVQSTTPGANGIAIDQTSLTAALSQSLLAAKPLAIEVPTQVVAFKIIYNRTYNLDSPKYVEVNLSTQHMWVYQDHQVVMDTPITSGSTGTGHPTVQGLYAVYTKERNRWLDGRPLGYHYDVWVQYWMPFYKDYGLHDASWRRSFGGPDYYYGGSHGCVNMPVPAAAWLFGWVDVGTPVWVHA